jgi:Domain of unknown function (DUF4126)
MAGRPVCPPYGVLLVAGLVGRYGVADTPEALQRIDVLIVVGALMLLEFVTDKIPTSTASGTPCTPCSGRRSPPCSARIRRGWRKLRGRLSGASP